MLHEKRREVGALLATLCAVSHLLNWGPFQWMSHWLDEQYVTMSAAALLAVVGIWWVFTKFATDAVAPTEGPVMLLSGDVAAANEKASSPAGEKASGKSKKKK